MKTFSALKKVI